MRHAGLGPNTVTLAELSPLVQLRQGFERCAESRVNRVSMARTFDDLESARAFEIVVLDPALVPSVGSYRFDLAVGSLADDVAAVIGGSPSATAVRTARNKGVALGEFGAGFDFSALLLHVRDLLRGGGEREISVLDAVCELCDSTASADELETLIADAAKALDTSIELRSQRASALDQPVRLVGAPPRYLVEPEPPSSASSSERAARAYLGRRVEELLQHELDSQAGDTWSAEDLVNELLLDEIDNSGAALRLRRMGFPVDGFHTAIRISSHEHGNPDIEPMTGRMRRQIRDASLAVTRSAPGEWTQSGTLASIVLIASEGAQRRDSGPLEIARTTRRLATEIDRLGTAVYIGVGTTQPGVEGIRATVREATTALRSAVDNRTHNEPHYFDRLGLGRALMQWAEIDWVKPVVNEALAPLLSQRADRRRESLRTLRTYLDTGRRVGETARRLHLHRNSVHYRIDRIEKMLDIDLDDPDERLFVELGCRIILNEN